MSNHLDTMNHIMQAEPLAQHDRFSITLKDSNQVYVEQIISYDLYNRIRREVSRTAKVSIDGQTYDVNQVIDMILCINDWDKSNREYDTKFLAPITSAFNHTDINPKEFAGLYQLQTNPNNMFRTELIYNPGSIKTLHSLLPHEFIDAFQSPQDAQMLFDMLYDITPSIANVSVGRGEIALSFISDATKGKKGDLEFPGLGEVEIKGDSATLGGDGHAVDQSATSINSVLKHVGLSLSDVALNQLVIKLKHQLSNIASIYQNAAKSKVDVAVINQLIDLIKSDVDVGIIIKYIDLSKLGKTYRDPLLKIAENIKQAQSPNNVHTLTAAIRLFFYSTDKLSYDSFIEGVLAMRSYYMRDKLPILTAAIKSLIPESSYNLYSAPSLYEPLIASLHLVCYLMKEKFNYIVFLNDRNKHAICYKSHHDAAADLKESFDFFSKNDFAFKFSVDPTRKSLRVIFNG